MILIINILMKKYLYNTVVKNFLLRLILLKKTYFEIVN